MNWRCVQCSTYGDALTMSHACPVCGCLNMRPIAARRVRYTWPHRLALWLAGHPQPRNYYETSDI